MSVPYELHIFHLTSIYLFALLSVLESMVISEAHMVCILFVYFNLKRANDKSAY